MLNSKFVFILAVNIAVLSANIWFFTSTPPSGLEASSAPNDSLGFDIPPIVAMPTEDDFPFPLRDPASIQADPLLKQLALSQQQSDALEKRLKRIKQQSAQQLNTLRSNNRLLHQQLSFANQQRLAYESEVAGYQQHIARLQGSVTSLPVRQTESERVRESIQRQPNLIKSREPKLGAVRDNAVIQGEVAESKEVDPFSGSMEFGFSYEQDNQITQSIDGRLVLDYDKHDLYNINSELDFEFEDEGGEMTTGKYRWQLQSDYNLDPTNLVYARSDISRSKFSSYDKEHIFTLGYGRIFFDNPKHKFNLEVGPGYRFALPNVGEDAVSIDEFIVRTRINYERVVSESLQVKMDSVLETGHSNSVYSMGFKAQNRIYQQLYLIFDFSYKFTQNVPVDTVNEEASSGLSLLYAF